MFGVTTTIQGVSITPDAIEDAILSVLKDATPPWKITLQGQEDGRWKLFGQPADGPVVEAELTDDEHGPDAIRQIVFEWYERYKELRRHGREYRIKIVDANEAVEYSGWFAGHDLAWDAFLRTKRSNSKRYVMQDRKTGDSQISENPINPSVD